MSESKSLSRTASPELKLEVVGGVHSGVRLSLADGDYSIGCKSGADIVLRDEGVAAQHVIICIDGNDIRAEAIGGTLRVGDEEIGFGHGCRLRLPAEIKIGSALLRLSSDRKPFPASDMPPLMSRIAERPAVAVTGMFGVALAGTLAWHGLQPVAADAERSEFAMIAKSGAATAALQSGGLDAKADDVAHELQDKLRDAGLATIKISADGAHLTATGRLPESRAAEWTAIQRWFDKTYSPRMVLSTNVASDPASAAPAIRLQSIWYGPRPHIIAGNGVRYYEGSVVDGWVLAQITEDGVTLKKGEENLTLNYR